MKIGIDASTTLAPRTGIGRFTLELLRALIAASRNDVEFVLLVNSRRREMDADHDFLRRSPRVRIAERRLPGPMLVQSWARLRMPTLESLLGESIDVAFASAGYLPPTRAPLVATVHDVSFLRDAPEDLAPLGGRLFKESWPRLLPQAAAIVTVSEFVRRDLLACYEQIDPARVSSAHLGVDHTRESPVHTRPRRWFFAVAAEEPRKRLDLLLESYTRLRSTLGAQAPPLKLVGASRKRSLPAGVERLGWLADEEMRICYEGAIATVITSREEGFGLPMLEAMRAGSPVVCGRNSSLAEIGAGVANFVREESAAGFADAMRALCEEPVTDAESLRLQAHAARFTWARTANHYFDVFDRIAGSGVRR